MGAKGRAKDAAKRYLSPEAQEILKTLTRRATGPRKPTRLKPPPSDPEGAARHAVLTAHASGRASDHARARKSMGRWTLGDASWSVALPARTVPDAQASAVDVVIVGPAAASTDPSLRHARSADDADATTLRIGLPGAIDADITPLPHAADLLGMLGPDERAAVLAAAALGPLRGRRLRSVTAAASSDPAAAAIARSLQAFCEGPHT